MSTVDSIANIETDLKSLILRVNSLEAELAQLKQKPPAEADWVGRIIGSFKDDPGYDEVIEMGRQIRKSDFS